MSQKRYPHDAQDFCGAKRLNGFCTCLFCVPSCFNFLTGFMYLSFIGSVGWAFSSQFTSPVEQYLNTCDPYRVCCGRDSGIACDADTGKPLKTLNNEAKYNDCVFGAHKSYRTKFHSIPHLPADPCMPLLGTITHCDD